MNDVAAQIAKAGRSAFPDVTLTDEVIEVACAARAPARSAGEVFLAIACGHGDARAIAYFETLYVPEVRRFVAGRSSNRAHIDEVVQRLRATVLAPRVTRRGRTGPEILDYSGAGPLVAWLRIAAHRILIRFEATERRKRAAVPGAVVPHAAVDPEAALHRRGSNEALRRALHAAWLGLDADDRLRLRVRYAEGCGIDHVARLEGVHRATAARRLVRAQHRLVTGARTILRRTLRLSDAELDSVLRGLHSQNDVTLTSLFRHSHGPPRD